jgi:DNA-binding NarL/FixJ family response regulator
LYESDGYLPDLFQEARWRKLAAHFGLSPRHAQIARLLCRGFRKDAIAKNLGVSQSTVRMHAIELFKRLDVHDRIGVPVRLVLADRAFRSRKRPTPWTNVRIETKVGDPGE